MLTFQQEKIGSAKNLVYSKNSFKWSDSHPSSLLALDDSCMSFENMLKLFHRPVPPFIPEKFSKAAKTLGVKSPPWYHFLGKEVFMDGVNAYTEAYEGLLAVADTSLIKRQLMIECMIRRMYPAPYNPEKINKDVGNKFGSNNNLNKKIDELNQETENLIDEIEKWQT